MPSELPTPSEQARAWNGLMVIFEEMAARPTLGAPIRSMSAVIHAPAMLAALHTLAGTTCFTWRAF